MKFSLRALLVLSAAIPPLLWILVKLLRPSEDGLPEPILDPIVLCGAAAWVALYYHLVHKRAATP